MSELSEHDRAELDRIELRLSIEDPRLARVLGGFGRKRPGLLRRLGSGRWLCVDLLVVAGLCLVPLLIGFAR